MVVQTDSDPAKGSKTLTRTDLEVGFEVDVETQLGQTNSYRVEPETDGARLKRTRTYPDGTSSETRAYLDGHRVTTHPDGTVVTSWSEPDPRFGMLAPVTAHSQVTLPLGGLTSHTYARRFEDEITQEWVEQVSRNSSFTDPLEHRYDAATREGTITTPEGRISSYELDSAGRLVSLSAPGVTSIEITRDPFGRVIEVEQGPRRVTFDRTAGFVDEVIAYLGMVPRETEMTHDGVGRILSVLLPDLESIGLGWDSAGRLVSLTPPTDQADPEPHAMSYDPVGMLTEYDPPNVMGVDPDETSYGYDADHRLTSVKLPSGEMIGIDYDAVTHRVQEVTTSEGASIVVTYDAAGRVNRLAGPIWDGLNPPSSPTVELTYGYNGPLVTSESWSGETQGTVARVFNNRGEVTSQSINAGSPVSFSYDDDGLLQTAGVATLSRGATTGRIESVSVSSISQSLSYDAFGEVEGSAYAYTGGPSDLYEYALERDELGRIVEQSETIAGGTPVAWEYEYDVRGRLIAVDKNGTPHASYTYDPNGNRLSVTTSDGTMNATYDEQDRIEEYGDWTYTHSANGEIRGKTDGTDTWEYQYDALGNLRSVTLPDATVISYEYDARGRLVARYEDGTFDKGWLWTNQLEPIAEVDEAGDVTARYVYASRGHVPDYVITGGVTYRLITDYRGSVVRVVNASTGAVVQAIEYTPWGEMISDSASGFQSFGYAGGIWDADTGLVLFGARWYDPETGRWTSKDPIRFAGGQENLYVYVADNPIDRIDQTGLAPGDPYPTREAAVADAVTDLRGTIKRPGFPIDEDNPEMGTQIYAIDVGCVSMFGVCLPIQIYSYYAPSRGSLFAPPTVWEPQLGDCPAGAQVVMEFHTHPNNEKGTARGDEYRARQEGVASVIVGPFRLWYLPIGDFWTEVEFRRSNGFDEATVTFQGPF